MSATWTDPRTWATNEFVTATIMNTHVRDNITWLKTPLESGKVTFAADLTTTSVTYTDMTGVTTTLTTKGGGLDVDFRFTCIHSAAAQNTFQLLVDGVSETILGTWTSPAASQYGVVSGRYHIAALTAGSHTFKIQYKTGSGTLTVKGTTSAVGDPFFFVREAGA